MVFNNKLGDLRKVLRRLGEEGLAEDGTYYNYMLLLWKSRTIERIDEIAHDLAEICHSPSHPLSSPRC